MSFLVGSEEASQISPVVPDMDPEEALGLALVIAHASIEEARRLLLDLQKGTRKRPKEASMTALSGSRGW